MIDWNNLGCALELQHLHNKVRLVKFMHNWLNTGSQKKKIDKNGVADCPAGYLPHLSAPPNSTRSV
eukprot:400363-Ditylum_brightwellii.AAC.1